VGIRFIFQTLLCLRVIQPRRLLQRQNQNPDDVVHECEFCGVRNGSSWDNDDVFVLAYQDCTLLTGIVAEGVAISDVLIWNHLRHVTVCFLHLLIYISERRFISRVANECLRLKTTDPLDLMFAYVIIIPVVIGVLHSCFFDDSHIYRFQESAVGRHCMIAFGLSVVVASAYYVYGPIRSTYNEAQHPFALGLAIEMDLILETRKTILI
jgi:hypothetical protein